MTPPKQFGDIGYLCHLNDPFGYSIELLQHDFQCNFCPERTQSSLQPNLAPGQQTHLGQITLRVSDIEKTLSFYQCELSMKLLSRQSIPSMFDLYFLACTDEKPPSDDLNAVEIREWLWKRPYTTLELQHWPQQNRKFNTANLHQETGFSALAFTVDAQRFDELKTTLSVQDVSKKYPEYEPVFCSATTLMVQAFCLLKNDTFFFNKQKKKQKQTNKQTHSLDWRSNA